MKNSKLVGYILQDTAIVEVKPKILSQTDKTITFDSVLQVGDDPNRNKRVYGIDLLLAGLNSAFVRERIMTNSWGGEREHPQSDDPQRLVRLERSELCHFVKNWRREGKQICGNVQTAATSAGIELKDMILENNLVTGFSMRGFGETYLDKNTGISYVRPPFRLFYYDAVTHPSHREAYMTNTLTESCRTTPITLDHLEALNKADPVLFENMDMLGLLEESAKMETRTGKDLIVTHNGTTMNLVLNEAARMEINSFFTSLK